MKEEEIRKRDIFNKYLELSAKDVEVFFKDRSRFIKYNCPACNSNETVSVINKNNFTYDECKKCNTLFVNPRPPLNMINDFYTNSPSTLFWVNEFFMPVSEIRREKIFKPRAEYISNIIREKEKLIIGDIGAGFGLFLEELRKIKNQNTYIAIEPSVEMAKICSGKNIQVINKLLENVDASDFKFNVLTSFELFEHLYNPREFLLQVFNLLEPNGYFIFTTLNGLGFDIQLLWEKSKSITPPHHLNFFNPWSIEILLKEVGFKIIEISTPGVLDWDIIEGGFIHEKVSPGKFFETVSRYGNENAKKELQDWISKHNFSSHMRIIVQR